jgi:hypothetical protein
MTLSHTLTILLSIYCQAKKKHQFKILENESPRRKQQGILMEQQHSLLRRKRRGI